MAASDREGRSLDYANHQMHLGEVCVRAGDLAAASAVLGLGCSTVEAEALETPDDERLRALMAALRGDVVEVERLAPIVFDAAERVGDNWSRLEIHRALALTAAVRGDLEAVAQECRFVWDWTEREGVREVGAFPVAGELVEALVGLRRVDEARGVASRLRDLATQQSHPWGLVTAERSDALIELAARPAARVDAIERLRSAVGGYGALALGWDEARTQLVLGAALTEVGELEEAELVLSQAAEQFTQMGALAWVERVRSVQVEGGHLRRAMG
jgi:hypothetical protein